MVDSERAGTHKGVVVAKSVRKKLGGFRSTVQGLVVVVASKSQDVIVVVVVVAVADAVMVEEV
jgi:hypothetical protein